MKKMLFLIAMILALAAVSWYRVRMIESARAEENKGIETIQREKGFPVVLAEIKIADFSLWREIEGKVQGSKEAYLSTPDRARIKAINFKIGDIVPADAPVIVLDESDPQNASRVELLRKVYEEAKSDHQKMQRLYEKGAVSEDVVSKTKLRMDKAKSDLDSALTAVELVSPIPGVLISLIPRVGERVEKDKTVATVASLDQVMIVADVSDQDQADLEAGQAAIIEADGVKLAGEVDRVSLGADPQTGLFGVDIVVENKDNVLRIGTYAIVGVRVLHRENVASVNSNAVDRDPSGQPFVWQVVQGQAKKVLVNALAVNDEYTQIEGPDLDVSLPVVLRGKSQLREGAPVFEVKALEAGE